MAAKIKRNPFADRGVGRRKLIVVKALMIVLFVMQPSLGGSSSSGSSSGGGCSGGTQYSYSKEIYEDYKDKSVDLPVAGYSETLEGGDYLALLLGDASNRFDPRLPGYSYFQGVLQSDNHVTVAGQVRVVGGLIGAKREDATGNLYSGAMVTTNAHAFAGAGDALTGGPAGVKTRIRNWEEVPNP